MQASAVPEDFKNSMNSQPTLTVIVVFHNMAREAPRTLFTLSAEYQRGVCPGDYEVIVVDAGSATPLEESFVKRFGENFRLVRSPAAPSPVVAVNRAVTLARGEAIALCIDGARMLTPGILRHMLDAFKTWNNPVVATLAWHLGPKIQNESMLEGYNQAAEDSLLDSVDWRADGYELFRISSLAGSSKNGWFCPIGESNCVAVRKEAWSRLGGLHDGFVSPGGGLVNLDFYREACLHLDPLVVLLGEGTFHQFHGGVATNVPWEHHPKDAFNIEYTAVRGEAFGILEKDATYLGGIPPQALGFLQVSVTKALEWWKNK
jgi:hypothetical protein